MRIVFALAVLMQLTGAAISGVAPRSGVGFAIFIAGLVILLLAGVVAGLFHRSSEGDVPRWGAGSHGPPITLVGRVCTFGSIFATVIILIWANLANLHWELRTYEFIGGSLAGVLVLGITFDHLVAWLD